MRRTAVILLMLACAAAPVGAQTPDARPIERQAAPVEPAPPSTSPAAFPTTPVVGDLGGRCRLACAQAYYFCLASDTPDDCPGAWGQCRAACATAASRPGR
jgi:hypothetical protein